MILGGQDKAFTRTFLSDSAGTDYQKTRSLKISQLVQPQLEICTVSSHFNINKVKIGKKTN